MPAAKKFTAANLPTLIKIAEACGLTHVVRCDSKNYTFALAAPGSDGRYALAPEADEGKLAEFCERAEQTFGDRAHFWASNRWSHVDVTWERDTRTQAQLDNVD